MELALESLQTKVNRLEKAVHLLTDNISHKPPEDASKCLQGPESIESSDHAAEKASNISDATQDLGISVPVSLTTSAPA